MAGCKAWPGWVVLLVLSSTLRAFADDPKAAESPAEASFQRHLSLAHFPHSKYAFSIRFSRDGSRLASIRRGGLEVWDGVDGRLLHKVGTAEGSHWPVCLELDDTGRLIAIGSQVSTYLSSPNSFRTTLAMKGSLANVWDEGAGQYTREYVNDREDRHLGTALSGDGQRVVCFDLKLNAKIWDIPTGELLASIPAPEFLDGRVRTAGVGFRIDGRASRDATRFAVRISNAAGPNLDYEGPNPIQLVDLATRRYRTIPAGPADGFGYSNVTMSHAGRLIAGLAIKDSHPEPTARNAGLNVQERKLVIIDFDSAATRTEVALAPADGSPVLVEFSPDDLLIALGTADGHLDLIDTLKGTSMARLRVSDGPVRAVAFPTRRVRVVADRRMISAPGQDPAPAGPARLVDYPQPTPP